MVHAESCSAATTRQRSRRGPRCALPELLRIAQAPDAGARDPCNMQRMAGSVHSQLAEVFRSGSADHFDGRFDDLLDLEVVPTAERSGRAPDPRDVEEVVEQAGQVLTLPGVIIAVRRPNSGSAPISRVRSTAALRIGASGFLNSCATASRGTHPSGDRPAAAPSWPQPLRSRNVLIGFEHELASPMRA